MTSYIDPDPQHFAMMKDLPLNHPVNMLNLVRLRDNADYKDGQQKTGAEAYAEYGRLSGPIFARLGGKIIWSATFEHMVIGPVDEKWDIAFIAEYPTGQAFLDMVFDPDYRAIVHHRTAAVKTSRLIRLKPKTVNDGFA